MHSISWEKVTPRYQQLLTHVADIQAIKPIPFETLQPRFVAALEDFVQLDTSLMWVCGLDNRSYRQLVTDATHQVLSTQSSNRNVHLVEQPSLKSLFGHYSTAQDGSVVHEAAGLLQTHPNDIFVLPMSLFAKEIGAWESLKNIVLGGTASKLHVGGPAVSKAEQFSSNAKFVFVGERNQLGDLEYFDSEALSSITVFSELELDLKLTQSNVTQYIGWLNTLCNQQNIPALDSDGVTEILRAGARECEEQHYASLCPLWISRLLSEAKIAGNGQIVTAQDIIAAQNKRYYRESYLINRALDDILDGQVVIKTQGEQIGQVNGLTVVDIPGHPISYGEPARISCVVHFGDGDISDVERKADLGGNLHAKGMMIMQAFIASEMKLDEPLPFSSSIVFEQSYSEVDGDSASLAEFCALSSALSQAPIKQNIAVTGAMDQFGQVQAVGGLNEKIEGFFYVCHHQGLTGEQGVIMPKANLRHLALHSDVVEAIKAKRFHIWCVEDVDQALQILMDTSFKQGDDSVINKIEHRIHQLDEGHRSQSLKQKLLQWFNLS